MRVAITGVGGTGKSTLGRLISNNTCLDYIHDVNDTVLIEDMGYLNGNDLFNKKGEEGMIDWHMRAMTAKLESDRRDNYVTEKTVFDFGTRWFARMYPSSKKVNHDVILDGIAQGASLYDRIIFLPLNLERKVEDNSLRNVDSLWRLRFEWILRGMYQQHGVDYLEYDFDFSSPPKQVIKDLNLDKL